MKEKQLGTFYGVGVGPGDPRLLTLQAVEVLRRVDVIFHVAVSRTETGISRRLVDSIEGCRAERVELRFSMTADKAKRRADWKRNAKRVVRELRAGRHCALVTIGDPLLYSTYTHLLREVRKRMPLLEVITVPGITAFQAAAARAHLPLAEDDEVLTIVPAWKKELATLSVAKHADTMVFLKTYRHRNRILAQLKSETTPPTVLYAARVGLDGERIELEPKGLENAPEEYLSLLIVKRGGGLRKKPHAYS